MDTGHDWVAKQYHLVISRGFGTDMAILCAYKTQALYLQNRVYLYVICQRQELRFLLRNFFKIPLAIIK